MSRRSDKSKPQQKFVRVEDCSKTHDALADKIGAMEGNVEKIVNTLLGDPVPGSLQRKGGVVDDLKEMRSNMGSRWSTKEKAAVVTTFITAFTAVLIALLR